jgi:uncharacterized protein YxjI
MELIVIARRKEEGHLVADSRLREPVPFGKSSQPVSRYRMSSSFTTATSPYRILNDFGECQYLFDVSALETRGTLAICTANDDPLFKIHLRGARVASVIEIEDSFGREAAVVQKTSVSPLRDEFVIRSRQHAPLSISGNILDHEYRIGQIALVSKQWFHATESYGLQVKRGNNDALLLAALACIDEMTVDVR